MSVNPSRRARGTASFEKLKHAGSGIAVVALLILGFQGSHYFAPIHEGDEPHEGAMVGDTAAPTEVTLPLEKVNAADIHVAAVRCIDLQETKTVAATIEYDATRHLVIKAPVACVLEQLLVRPGQVVSEGDRLAIFSGAEVSVARTEIKKCEADVELAELNLQWRRETNDNLRQLLATLQQEPPIEEIESQFEGRRLGEDRDHLLTAYSQYVLAKRVAKRSKPLGDQSIIAGRTAEARSSERDVAVARFKAACEQSEFEGRRALAKARTELEVAKRTLDVAEERLRLLLGPLASDPVGSTATGEFAVTAPFDGRIEALHASPASRLTHGDPTLTLADTSRLWLSARIHQHDWDVLHVQSSAPLRFTLPAIPDEEFLAELSFVGPEVSADTRALSLVAELNNPEGRLRPGMFAWVALPVESPRQGLVVPTSAVQRHEGETFVFVADLENHFQRVDVTTGLETVHYVEITQGLSAGQEVVDRGAFYLKSELLLEQEEE